MIAKEALWSGLGWLKPDGALKEHVSKSGYQGGVAKVLKPRNVRKVVC